MIDYKKNSAPIAFVLVLLLVFSMFTPMAYAASDVKNTLKNIVATVSQGGQEITSGGALDPSKEIKITYSFDVPVEGDYPTPAQFVKGGDTAVFDLPNQLILTNSTTQALQFDGETIGTVTFAGDKATVTFSDALNVDAEGNGIMNVKASFEANMRYDASGAPAEGKDVVITILDKTFTIHIPPKKTIVTGAKTGTVDITNKTVNWMVEVNASLEGGGSGKLEGYTFSDDLTNVGEYVADSFKIGQSTDAAIASSITGGYTNGALSYTFPVGTTGTQYLFFQTKIPDSKIFTTTKQSISNTAEIRKGTEPAITLKKTVDFQMEWIKKNGAVVGGSEGSNDSYDPTNRQIKWTIQANQMGVKINNAKIIDTLPAGLTFVSATAIYRTVPDGSWGAETPITPAIDGQKLTFDVSGGLTLGKEVMLTLVTKVDNTSEASVKVDFVNSATLTGEGLPGGGFGSGNYTVGIGFNPISKSAGAYDKSSHKMNWTVTVNTKNQSYGGSLRVLDLLVYGTGFTASDFSSLNEGAGLTGITGADVAKLTPQFNQKYAGNFKDIKNTGLEVTVHTLTKGGKAVADVLIVTKTGGQGIDYTTTNAFSFDTLVTNPDIYASNATTDIKNTATLFSGSLLLNTSTSTKQVQSEMLKKDMLSRDKAIEFENDENDLAAVNSNPAGAGGGFNYDDKSVIFRIHVNANGLKDATDDVTTEYGVSLGALTVTDTLPKGWEFKKLHGKDFLIYEAAGSSLKATGSAIDSYSGFLTVAGPAAPEATTGGTITFTFTELKKPYIILVKAGPTKEMANEYFSKNDSYSPFNSVTMSNEHYSANKAPKDTETVTIESKLLDKTYVRSTEGYLTWTVEYKPYDLKHEGAYIEDVLPIGLDLPMNSQGKLVLDGNITVTELNMGTDGNYAAGAIVSPLDNLITYNNATRVLRFDPPDTQKAYRLTYKTDITGDPGANITNKVTLYAEKISSVDTNKSYQIVNADSNAVFQRGGVIKITKTDSDGKFLAGAEFTLFASDGVTTIRKGISGSDGLVQLRAIVPGDYILKETKAPAGYNLLTKSYQVSVVKNGSKIEVSFDGVTLTGITVKNLKTGTVGDLRISKTVAGNAGDTTKEFNFTVNFSDGKGYPYLKSDNTTGTMLSGGKITLAHGQHVTIMEIPKDVTYSAIEQDYSSEDYATTKTDDSGTIVADTLKIASFTNTKNKPGGPGGGGGGGTSTPPGVVTTPGGVTTPGAITPEAIYGSVKIIKEDGDDTSRTLSGAVFQLFSESGKLIRTSAATGSDGVVVFDGLEAGQKYYLKEKTAPAGYKVSDQTYSFRLDEEGRTDISVTFKNYQEGTEEISGIDPEEIPAGWIIEEEGIPAGPGDLDDTPKTGVSSMPLILMSSLTALTGAGLLLNGIQARRRKLISFRKGK